MRYRKEVGKKDEEGKVEQGRCGKRPLAAPVILHVFQYTMCCIVRKF
jgi:hypothetical protein